MTQAPPEASAAGPYSAHQPACPTCSGALPSRAARALQVECPHEGCSALLSTTRRCAACRGHACVPREVTAWRCSCTAVNVRPAWREAGRWQLWHVLGIGVAVVVAGALLIPPGGSVDDLEPEVEDTLYEAGGGDDVYMESLADNGLLDGDEDDSDLVSLASAMCTALDGGAGAEAVISELMSAGISGDQAGALLGSAIGAYCPEHAGSALDDLDG